MNSGVVEFCGQAKNSCVQAEGEKHSSLPPRPLWAGPPQQGDAAGRRGRGLAQGPQCIFALPGVDRQPCTPHTHHHPGLTFFFFFLTTDQGLSAHPNLTYPVGDVFQRGTATSFPHPHLREGWAGGWGESTLLVTAGRKFFFPLVKLGWMWER